MASALDTRVQTEDVFMLTLEHLGESSFNGKLNGNSQYVE